MRARGAAVDRCGGIDASALGRLLDDEIDGALGQWTAGAPNGLEYGRGRQRLTAAAKLQMGRARVLQLPGCGKPSICGLERDVF